MNPKTNIAILLVTLMAAFEAGAGEGKTNVIAHRGASAYAPENTLAAFELAVEMGAHWFELDCWMTKDGEIVVIHDHDLERTTDKEGRIRDLTLKEVRRADAGGWYGHEFTSEPIPTLNEALALAKDRIGVYIEIKDALDDRQLREELLELGEKTGPFLPDHRGEMMAKIGAHDTRNLETALKVIHLVKMRGMEKQVVIQSFSPIVCAVVLAEAPDLRVELLASSNNRVPRRWPEYLRWLELLKPHGFNIDKKDVTPELIQRIRSNGQSMAVYTVNDEVEMQRLIELGVDAIITDKPDIGLNAVAAAGQ